MSRSQPTPTPELSEQFAALIESALTVLHGTAGFFVFDPQVLPNGSIDQTIWVNISPERREFFRLLAQRFHGPTRHLPQVFVALAEHDIILLALPTTATSLLSALLVEDKEGRVGTLYYVSPQDMRRRPDYRQQQAFGSHLALSLRFALRASTLQRKQNQIAEDQRSLFISVISHELQTPIAIIKGYASTLSRPDAHFDREVIQSRLVAIDEEADRLNKLVQNLLYASRIQAGALRIEIVPIDLAPLLQSVVRRMQARAPSAHFVLNLPPYLPPVMADWERIEEVVTNLCENAIKYSPRDQQVTISATATGEEVITSVADTGMGISPRDQEKIFGRFQRLGNPLAQTVPGAGLGLYICRSIVEAHGGRIWVESALHHGSTFSFSLPREEKAQLPMVVF